MICTNCKKEIADGSKFCEFCGNKVEATPVQEQGMQSAPSGGQTVQATPKKPLDPKLLKIIIGGAAALLVVILIIVLVVTRKKTIDLQDYTEVTFTGYDGYGKASIEFDSEKFYKDIKEYAKIDDTASDALKDGDWASALEDSLSTYTALDDIEYELDKDSKLSNGDTVTIKFEYDNDAAGEIGLKFKGNDEEFEVKGLDKVKSIDPFEYVTVEFTGTSPNASINWDVDYSSEDVMGSISFSASKTSEIAKGDTVTVTADADEDTLLENYGCKLSKTSKDFTCENVDEYITKYADISEDYLETIKKQAEDVLDAYFAGESQYIKADKLKFEGYYFLSCKNASTWGDHNILDLVYSTTVTSKDKAFKKSKVYIPVEFTNVMKYADGTFYVNLESGERKGQTDLSYSWYSRVSGYTATANMYNELVAVRKAEYTAEATEALK